MANDYIYFWAKTLEDGKMGISVENHCKTVGIVAQELYRAMGNPEYWKRLDIPTLGWLGASHDVGKIFKLFQIRCEDWKENYGGNISQVDIKIIPQHPHGRVTQRSLFEYLSKAGFSKRSALFWGIAVGSHHGIILRTRESIADGWEECRQNLLNKLNGFFGEFDLPKIEQEESFLWWIAGLICLADWIGSDERNFSPSNMENLDAEAVREKATKVVSDLGFGRLPVKRRLKFQQLFRFEPNELQKKMMGAVDGKGLYLIQAPMGMGKTEAALIAAYQLMAEGKANGIYFGLPTQLTSNKIHERVAEFVQKVSEDSSRTRLIHGNSWLKGFMESPKSREIDLDGETNKGDVEDWFQSPKRALLDRFGVGTVDQALLSTVAAKHFFLRRFALAGKVIVLDEVHSYDIYTGTLIQYLCEHSVELGCTVIVLSATLTAEKTRKLSSFLENAEIPEKYPMITRVKESGEVDFFHEGIGVPEHLEKEVKISFSERKRALERAKDEASKGVMVLWIANTVQAAQEIFCEVRQKSPELDAGLLHSRFTFSRRQELEKYWLEKFHQRDSKRKGCLLIATQIVEQSVDLDADLMFSELAPGDMLLQRMGRLWRHNRENRGKAVPKPEMVILKEKFSHAEFIRKSQKEVIEAMGTKSFVYSPYVLLRTLKKLEDLNSISLPGEIRPFIESIYHGEVAEGTVEETLMYEKEGSDITKTNQAIGNSNVMGITLEDDEKIQVRSIDYEQVPLLLCTAAAEKRFTLLDGSVLDLANGEFKLRDKKNIFFNLVKIPKNKVSKIEENPTLRRYTKEDCLIGLVNQKGEISLLNSESANAFSWNKELGVFLTS